MAMMTFCESFIIDKCHNWNHESLRDIRQLVRGPSDVYPRGRHNARNAVLEAFGCLVDGSQVLVAGVRQHQARCKRNSAMT